MDRLMKKCFTKDEVGVSGAITAMMMILIISSFISMLYAVYIPSMIKEDEADHSKTILSQFLDLKETIDDQIINREENEGISVTSRVTLGREGGPIFGMGRTTGVVTVDPYHGIMKLINSDSPDEVLAHGRGNITFESRYGQYINQHYIYEYGAVIVGQEKQNEKIGVMKVEPHFRAEKDLLGNVTITIVQVAFFGDRNSIAGTQDIVIETRLQGVDSNHISRDQYPTLENLTLNITTEYPDLWHDYFVKKLEYNVSGMDEWSAGTGDYRITKFDYMVSIEFWNVNTLNVDIAIMGVTLR